MNPVLEKKVIYNGVLGEIISFNEKTFLAKFDKRVVEFLHDGRRWEWDTFQSCFELDDGLKQVEVGKIYKSKICNGFRKIISILGNNVFYNYGENNKCNLSLGNSAKIDWFLKYHKEIKDDEKSI